MPNGLKEPEHVRGLSFGDEPVDVGKRRIDIGIDLIPIERPGGDELLETALGDAIDIRLVARFRAVVPVDEHERFRELAEELRMLRERVVPNERPPAMVRDHEIRRIRDVAPKDRALARCRDEIFRLSTTEIGRLVRTDMEERRRRGQCRQLVADEIFGVGLSCRVRGR